MGNECNRPFKEMIIDYFSEVEHMETNKYPEIEDFITQAIDTGDIVEAL